MSCSRGISAAGSAQHWQCWGQRFESAMLHKTKISELDKGSDIFVSTFAFDSAAWARFLVACGGGSGGEAASLREAPLPQPPSPEEQLGNKLGSSFKLARPCECDASPID